MPAVLDLIGGGAVMRSWLPLINRCGQSLPPLLLAPQIRSLRQKKWCTFVCTIMMSLIFFLLAWIWGQTGGIAGWVPVAFLLLYAFFFSCTGRGERHFAEPHNLLLTMIPNPYGSLCLNPV